MVCGLLRQSPVDGDNSSEEIDHDSGLHAAMALPWIARRGSRRIARQRLEQGGCGADELEPPAIGRWRGRARQEVCTGAKPRRSGPGDNPFDQGCSSVRRQVAENRRMASLSALSKRPRAMMSDRNASSRFVSWSSSKGSACGQQRSATCLAADATAPPATSIACAPRVRGPGATGTIGDPRHSRPNARSDRSDKEG